MSSKELLSLFFFITITLGVIAALVMFSITFVEVTEETIKLLMLSIRLGGV